MSEKQPGQASQRKPSTNKNIKKLRTISMVCGLASSWQQWVTENEEKQTSEPSGWAPSSLGGPSKEPRKAWAPKKHPPLQVKPTSEGSVEAQTSRNEEVRTSDEPPPLSCIKTKQVVKSVTGSIQEKSAGIGPLTEKMKKESLPSDEEIDRLLKKRSSPTRRRKCSNMVSSLTKSWKQVESEQKLVEDEGGPADERSCGADKDNRHSGMDKVDVEDAQTDVTNFSKEEEQNDSVRIKRPQVSM